MKKIDKLIITSFLGPFVLTFLVVVFILLMQHMLKYFDDIIGKDLGWDVVGTLLFYFAVFMTPVALPLAVLLSSLITFGNLGEHFELTAVKSLGISLVRSLAPIFVFVLMLTVVAFYANNYMVPKAALEAYSLLYDIKQKKPALDLKEGTFTGSIPDINIKVNKKFSKDASALKGVIIYDHRGLNGNKKVTVADSGRMYTILNNQFLKLELFKGYNYEEGATTGDDQGRPVAEQTYRKTKFDKMEVVFDLSSFGLNRTDKKWFQGNRIMRNLSELTLDMDSVNNEIKTQRMGIYTAQKGIFNYHFKDDSITTPKELVDHQHQKDSIYRARAQAKAKIVGPPSAGATPDVSAAATPTPQPVPTTRQLPGRMRKNMQPLEKPVVKISDKTKRVSDSLFSLPETAKDITSALNKTRMVKSQLQNYNTNIEGYEGEYKVFEIQWHKILSDSMACIAMFLIGAPLGAIIKKGGLGVPVIVSILFFIVFYVLNIMGEKWAKQGVMSVATGKWAADIILFFIGMLFLRQARADARLFDADFYNVMIDRIKQRFSKRKAISTDIAETA